MRPNVIATSCLAGGLMWVIAILALVGVWHLVSG